MYLDKGLVVFDSLQKCDIDIILYVLCMDDKCFEVLCDIGNSRLVPIRLSEIENDEMIQAKSNRSAVEYCWTCTPRLIQYVIEEYEPDICTYIDADIYFYQNPQILIDEMISAGKSAMVIPHHFTQEQINKANIVGTYCVEFNTFMNNDEGLEALDYWRKKCLETCATIGDGVHWGDQKYLDELVEKYPYVHVCEHYGAGVAFWNVKDYKMNSYSRELSLVYKPMEKTVDLVFYHFASIEYIDRNNIFINIWTRLGYDYDMIDRLYRDYLNIIEEKKRFLENSYDILPLIKSHPAINAKSLILLLANSGIVMLFRKITGRPCKYIVRL